MWNCFWWILMSTFSFNTLYIELKNLIWKYYSLSLVLLIFSVIHNEYVNFPKRATLGTILLLACTFVWVVIVTNASYCCLRMFRSTFNVECFVKWISITNMKLNSTVVLLLHWSNTTTRSIYLYHSTNYSTNHICNVLSF